MQSISGLRFPRDARAKRTRSATARRKQTPNGETSGSALSGTLAAEPDVRGPSCALAQRVCLRVRVGSMGAQGYSVSELALSCASGECVRALKTASKFRRVPSHWFNSVCVGVCVSVKRCQRGTVRVCEASVFSLLPSECEADILNVCSKTCCVYCR